MLTSEEINNYKRRLLEERKRIEGRIESYEDGGLREAMSASIGELSLYDNHPGDVGSEVFERAKDFALREDAAELLGDIDDALERIDRGDYGSCEICNGEISRDRLDALPYTTLCLDCKRKSEEMPQSRIRPVEEKVLEEIYEHGLDKKKNFYDWEDSWQDVARWNEHAPFAESGSYYGDNDLATEDRGAVEDVDSIPVEKDEDGIIYQSFKDLDNNTSERETR
ncbi:DnaK suppressor protein [Desulfocucumis palustris]|uniref:DnaK suppressor protein n=1 Tax=Desulfocucumis palustris TaxID=1898651 RepID=A0A2L2XBL6_9FIRM|nr:TraR/DksA C4-type zinc finger protein [Desulfocucumis palustris]GBF33608.1 DnaK suppressor protein [Desulfocucumis palustris]